VTKKIRQSISAAGIGLFFPLLFGTAFPGSAGTDDQNDSRRILLLADDSWGANWNIEDEKSSLSEMFLSFGWKLDLASVKGEVASCEFARQATGVKSLRMDVLISDIGSVKGYDAVIVLPGQSHENLMASRQALALLREADREGLVVAGFCRGVRVLAAAGVVRDHRITGHPDYADEYRSAGAVYLGFKDLEKKADAPPPVVDGNLVTVVRSKYYRKEAGEAIRTAIDKAAKKASDL
jgi:putative intracellular protease/amidase